LLLKPSDELAVGGRSAARRPHATRATACAGGRRWARRLIPGIKTAFSASMAKNKPPKDQPNSRVVARSLIKQQRYG
jgi:hypothetical protein